MTSALAEADPASRATFVKLAPAQSRTGSKRQSLLAAVSKHAYDNQIEYFKECFADKAPNYLVRRADKKELVHELESWAAELVRTATKRDAAAVVILLNPDPIQGTFHSYNAGNLTVSYPGSSKQRAVTCVGMTISLGWSVYDQPIDQIKAVICHEIAHLLQALDGWKKTAFPVEAHKRFMRMVVASIWMCTLTVGALTVGWQPLIAASIALLAVMIAFMLQCYDAASKLVQRSEHDADARAQALGADPDCQATFLMWCYKRSTSGGLSVLGRFLLAAREGKYYEHPLPRARIRAIRRNAKESTAKV